MLLPDVDAADAWRYACGRGGIRRDLQRRACRVGAGFDQIRLCRTSTAVGGGVFRRTLCPPGSASPGAAILAGARREALSTDRRGRTRKQWNPGSNLRIWRCGGRHLRCQSEVRRATGRTIGGRLAIPTAGIGAATMHGPEDPRHAIGERLDHRRRSGRLDARGSEQAQRNRQTLDDCKNVGSDTMTVHDNVYCTPVEW